MSKRLVLLLGVLLLPGLVACRSQMPGATLSKSTPLPTAAPTATLVAVLPTPKPTATTSPVLEDTPTPAFEVTGTKPSPTPTRPWQIPQVQTDDWVKGGGDDAGLTVVEYGDFQ